MAARLAATVYVTDPDTHESVRLDAGTEPEERLALLVTNPAAWEGGQVPDFGKADDGGGSKAAGDDAAEKGDGDKPKSPSRRRPAKPE